MADDPQMQNGPPMEMSDQTQSDPQAQVYRQKQSGPQPLKGFLMKGGLQSPDSRGRDVQPGEPCLVQGIYKNGQSPEKRNRSPSKH